jgi:2-hydroxychromene-2-carboxylate isomerase
MIPNPVKWVELELKRILTRTILDTERNERIKQKREQKRSQEGRGHVIHYFHQIDDPYSHLCAQVLPLISENYAVEVESFLVPPPTKEAAPEPELLMRHSLKDANMIAPHYGLKFPLVNHLPNHELIRMAQSALISRGNYTPEDLIKIGDLFWANDQSSIENMISSIPVDEVVDNALSLNAESRKKFGHYLGGVFVYEGECYWGIDRLPLLEKRLKKLGLKTNDGPNVVQRKHNDIKDIKNLDLEIDVLWSARSPYSYLAMKPLSELSKKYDVKLNYKIILPMVMRGMKVSLEKRTYITKDCKRIADQNNIPFGNIIDPLGYAVERCYSLYAFVKKHGKEEEYLWAFAESVWAHGKHGYLKKNLKSIIESIGLIWSDAEKELDSENWRDEVERNKKRLFGLGKWGPPTMILKNKEGKEELIVWGQDRIWLIEEQIKMMQT